MQPCLVELCKEVLSLCETNHEIERSGAYTLVLESYFPPGRRNQKTHLRVHDTHHAGWVLVENQKVLAYLELLGKFTQPLLVLLEFDRARVLPVGRVRFYASKLDIICPYTGTSCSRGLKAASLVASPKKLTLGPKRKDGCVARTRVRRRSMPMASTSLVLGASCAGELLPCMSPAVGKLADRWAERLRIARRTSLPRTQDLLHHS